MSEDQARQEQIKYLLEKADQALNAARRDLQAGDLDLATSRVYYACFYSASAVLLKDKRHFVRHAGLRAAVHKYLVKPGRVSSAIGGFFDSAFKQRQQADYGPWVRLDANVVATGLDQAAGFVDAMRALVRAS